MTVSKTAKMLLVMILIILATYTSTLHPPPTTTTTTALDTFDQYETYNGYSCKESRNIWRDSFDYFHAVTRYRHV